VGKLKKAGYFEGPDRRGRKPLDYVAHLSFRREAYTQSTVWAKKGQVRTSGNSEERK